MGKAARWRLAAALALAAGLMALLARLDWPKQQRLLAHGVKTDGWVTGKDLHGLRAVSYAFEAGGKTYAGTGVAGRGNLEFGDLAEGDRVLVFYLPGDPSVSTLGDPYEHLRGQNLALLVIILGVGGATAFLVRRELKKAAPRP